MPTNDEVRAALSTIFDADTGIYQDRGFQRRIGFGSRPALVHIDLGNAWTRPGHAFTCDGMDTIIPAVQALNEAGRAKGIPIVFILTQSIWSAVSRSRSQAEEMASKRDGDSTRASNVTLRPAARNALR